MNPLDVVDFLDRHGIPSASVASLKTTPDHIEIVRFLVDENGAKYATSSEHEPAAVAAVVEIWHYGDPPTPRFSEWEVRD